MRDRTTRERILELLRQKIAELAQPELQLRNSPHFTRWRDEVEAILRNFFMTNSRQLHKFLSAAHPLYGRSGFDTAVQKAAKEQKAHDAALPQMRAVLEAIVFELENLAGVARPSRYQLTSPIYWGEWLSCAMHFSTAVRWVKMHRLVSTIITLVMFVGAILAIWGFVLNW